MSRVHSQFATLKKMRDCFIRIVKRRTKQSNEIASGFVLATTGICLFYSVGARLWAADVIIPTPKDMCGQDESCLRRNEEALHLYREQQKTNLENSRGAKEVNLGEAEKSLPKFQKVRDNYSGFDRDQTKGNSYRDLIERERNKPASETRGTQYEMRTWRPNQKPDVSDFDQFKKDQAAAKQAEEEAKIKAAAEAAQAASFAAEREPSENEQDKSGGTISEQDTVTEVELPPKAPSAAGGGEPNPNELAEDSSEKKGKTDGYIRLERDGETTIIRTQDKQGKDASFIELTP